MSEVCILHFNYLTSVCKYQILPSLAGKLFLLRQLTVGCYFLKTNAQTAQIFYKKLI